MGAGAAAVGAAIADAGTSIIGSVISAGQARRNREWQEKMANTAHMREVKDLRAAGLNPILSATGGRGADTPSPAMPEISLRSNFSGAVASAQQARQLDMLEKKNNADIDLVDANSARANWETLLSKLEYQKKFPQELAALNAQTKLSENAAIKTGVDTQVSSATASNLRIENSLKELEQIKSEAEKGLYGGKSGKFIAAAEKLIDLWNKIQIPGFKSPDYRQKPEDITKHRNYKRR